MVNILLQQAVDSAVTMGPSVLMRGLQLRRPIDVVRAASLSLDDKRTVLAGWASNLYAADSQPSLRHLPGTPGPVSIDEVQSALQELDRRYHS